MAFDDRPETEEEKAMRGPVDLTATMGRALQATEPLETPADRQVEIDTSKPGWAARTIISDRFNKESDTAQTAATPVTVQAAETPSEEPAVDDALAGNDGADDTYEVASLTPVTKQERKDGYRNTGIGRVHFSAGQMSMDNMLDGFLMLLSFFLNGKFEDMALYSDILFPKEVYKDPGEREQRINDFKDVVSNPDHPDRQLSGIDFVNKYFGSLEPIKPQISKLLTMIAEKESLGGDVDVVYNYTGKGPLQPGDKTRGGLTVIDADTATVDQVLAWQKQYLDEQKSAGLSAGRRSSAIGAFQFTYTTLKEMRDGGLIAGDRTFDEGAQTELAIKRMLQMRGLGELLEGKASVNDIAREIRLEWEGAKHIPLNQLTKVLNDIKDGAHKLDEIKANGVEITDQPQANSTPANSVKPAEENISTIDPLQQR